MGPTPHEARLLTDEELAELSRSPRDELAARVGAGDVDGARATVTRMEAELHHQIERYVHWLSAIVAFSTDRWGQEGAARALVATRDLFAVHPGAGRVAPGLPETVVADVGERADASDAAGAMACFDGAIERWKAVVDLHRDWISALLSDLYRRHGPDELEAVHRHVGRATMDRLMAGIDEVPVQERLDAFVWLLKGHFADVEVTEEADRFVIDQDPCGTCGRQALDGCHGPPLSLAVVAEPHLVTWGQGDITIYRTHVPVWHVAMATERLGVPWPVNQCPVGVDDGSCRILLYKDPRNPAATAEVPGTLGSVG